MYAIRYSLVNTHKKKIAHKKKVGKNLFRTFMWINLFPVSFAWSTFKMDFFLWIHIQFFFLCTLLSCVIQIECFFRLWAQNSIAAHNHQVTIHMTTINLKHFYFVNYISSLESEEFLKHLLFIFKGNFRN